jgi:hypothetical protein
LAVSRRAPDVLAPGDSSVLGQMDADSHG